MNPNGAHREPRTGRDDDEPDWHAAQRTESIDSLAAGTVIATRAAVNNPDVVSDDEPIPPAERIRRALLTSEQVKNIEPPEPLVDGLLYLDSLAMLYGPSGTCKSFVSIDWALHVSYGSWWDGREVTGGPVLYVVAEGVSGVGIRVDAWQRHHQLRSGGKGVDWLPWAVNLFEPAWAGALAEVVAERRPALVVIDTYARCTVGIDENGTKDTGLVIAHLDQIRRAAASCVLLVHHSGKDLTAGARGSTALKGAMTTELELTGDPYGLVLKNPKQKDVPEAAPIPLRLRQVAGSESAVIARAVPEAGPPPIAPPTAQVTLSALEAVDVPEGVTATVWRKSTGVSESTFYRHRASLVEDGVVTNVSKTDTPRYRPTKALIAAKDDQPEEPVNSQAPLPGVTPTTPTPKGVVGVTGVDYPTPMTVDGSESDSGSGVLLQVLTSSRTSNREADGAPDGDPASDETVPPSDRSEPADRAAPAGQNGADPADEEEEPMRVDDRS